MTLSIRLVVFLIILIIHEQGEKVKPVIGGKNSPFKTKCLLSLLMTLITFLGGLLFDLFLTFTEMFGNLPVMKPFLIGLCTFLISVIIFFLSSKILKKSASSILFLPIILNLSFISLFQKADFWYMYCLALVFFLVSALLFFGIMERIKISPIPLFLQGPGIQLITLFLIFLSISFFRGVFLGKLF